MKQYKPFSFKQFKVRQNRAAMKVGTDSVLLGAWAHIKPGDKGLDIGTGTGILSLMLAQKVNGNCQLDALEKDPAAVLDAIENFEESPWPSCFSLFETPIQQFTPGSYYDVIISNPPFFDGLPPPNQHRTLARNTSKSFSLPLLLQFSSKWLATGGNLYLVLPFFQLETLQAEAQRVGLQMVKQLIIKPKQAKLPNRVLVCLQRRAAHLQSVQTEELIVRDDFGNYTQAHQLLTRAYYLNAK